MPEDAEVVAVKVIDKRREALIEQCRPVASMDEIAIVLNAYVESAQELGSTAEQQRVALERKVLEFLVVSFPKTTLDDVSGSFDLAVKVGALGHDGAQWSLAVKTQMSTKALSNAETDAILERLQSFHLTFCQLPLVDRADGTKTVSALGSGVLVLVGGVPHILTAAHVWDEQKGFQHLHMPVARNDENFLSLKTFFVRPVASFKRRKPGQKDFWPDLTLLRVGKDRRDYQRVIDRLQEKHLLSFYNLDQGRRLPWRWRELTSVIVGTPEEDLRVDGQVIDLKGGVVATGITDYYVGFDDHDCFDVDVTPEPEHPRVYTGCSGGGLWYIPTVYSIQRQQPVIVPRFARLCGVIVSRKVDTSSGKDVDRIIYCHGPRSIERLLEQAAAEPAKRRKRPSR